MSRRTTTAYRFWKRVGRPPRRAKAALANSTGVLYGSSKQKLQDPESPLGLGKPSGSENSMADVPDSLSSEAVRRAAEERIRLEAIRQLDTIDLDDDDPQIEPLPRFESIGLFNTSESGDCGYKTAGHDDEWDEVQGRFVPSDQDGCSGR